VYRCRQQVCSVTAACGAVPVVFVGQEKMQKLLSQVHRLEKVVVTDSYMAHAGPPGELGTHCPGMMHDADVWMDLEL